MNTFVPKTHRLWIVAVFGFGLLIGAGSLGEVLSVTLPGFMPPEASEIPFMAKHLSAIGLRSWVFLSNVVNLVCALVFIVSAIRLFRGFNSAWRHVGTAATTIGAVLVLSMCISAWYFFPMPIETGALEATKIIGLSMVAATIGMISMVLMWRWAARRHQVTA